MDLITICSRVPMFNIYNTYIYMSSNRYNHSFIHHSCNGMDAFQKKKGVIGFMARWLGAVIFFLVLCWSHVGRGNGLLSYIYIYIERECVSFLLLSPKSTQFDIPQWRIYKTGPGEAYVVTHLFSGSKSVSLGVKKPVISKIERKNFSR
jgi:hypothetical protein